MKLPKTCGECSHQFSYHGHWFACEHPDIPIGEQMTVGMHEAPTAPKCPLMSGFPTDRERLINLENRVEHLTSMVDKMARLLANQTCKCKS